jgi:small subunit ribosomal protein S1
MFEDDGSDEDILTMEDLELAGMSAEQPPAVGQQLTGYVIDVDDNGALLAIGGKKSGFIPLAEASLMPPRHMSDVVKVGDTVTAEMIGTLRGMPVMSLRSAQLVDAWKCVAKVRAADEPFAVQVAEVNRGGAVCNAFGGLKAFLPGSHYLGTPDDSIVGSSITVRWLLVQC